MQPLFFGKSIIFAVQQESVLLCSGGTNMLFWFAPRRRPQAGQKGKGK
jgi:hypothetical protein